MEMTKISLHLKKKFKPVNGISSILQNLEKEGPYPPLTDGESLRSFLLVKRVLMMMLDVQYV